MTVPALTLHLAEPQDLHALMRIHTETTREMTRRLGSGDWSVLPTMELLRAHIDRRVVFIARLDDDPVATVTASGTPAPFWPLSFWARPEEPAACIFAMAVLPRHRRRGIGAWMLDRVEEYAATRGLDWMRLDAYTANTRATSFYGKCGFTARGKVSRHGVSFTCFEKRVQRGKPVR